ncbi:hypothetical protein ACS0TY_017657 [Phlomoides rotata]
MPSRIRELTSLKTVSVFIVGDNIGNQLDELEHLNLGGALKIRHLERVQHHMNANLVKKPNLRDLNFRWEDDYNISNDLPKMLDDEKVLEALQPHPNLASLKIQGFRGREDLPLLKFLKLNTLDALEYIVEKDDIGCENSSGVKFPSLEELQLYSMPNLKGLMLKEEEVGGEMFPNLQSLSIWECPLLILTSTSTLKHMKDVSCNPLILPSLSSKLENLSSLRLQFDNIDDTTKNTCNNIQEEALQGLCNLKHLTVIHARKHRMPEKWSRDLNFVARLDLFFFCNIWSCLPEGCLGYFTSLQEIQIYHCTELFKHLHFLKDLTLRYIDDMV